MPTESPRLRMQAWAQERTPSAELGSLLRKKTVPLHAHYIWYFLGGMILFALTVQIVTGILLIVYYEPSVSDNPAVPGAHESVRRMVESLPHGWWIRSLHHWSAHLMIATVLLHLLSVLLMKAYRRPREVIWWSGLVLFALTLTAGFTGYLLPWNSLSFAATRVGSGIAAAAPFAGPLVRTLLLGGPDVSGVTLTRFFGLHVVVIPLLILATVGAHLVLVMYHGSSVPSAMKRQADAGRPARTVRFWPEFALRDFRLAMLAVAVLLVVAFMFPPPVGTRAEPLAPTPENVKPEWYFFPVFKMLKLLPTRALGLENLQLGVVVMGLIGATLLAMPLLDTGAVETATSRRRAAIKRRILLTASLLLGSAATAAPARVLVAHYWPPAAADWRLTAVSLAVVLIWLLVVLWIDFKPQLHGEAPATLFGWTLLSSIVGYTLWEGFGAVGAVAGLGVLWGILLIFWLANRIADGIILRLTRFATMLLILAALASTVALGGSHQEFTLDASGEVAAAPENRGVPPERRRETASRLAAALCACAFVAVAVDRRIHLQHKIREMGLAS
jgi:quinol-cytochrome oxidoreductase complex cytochrome b subunit